jgi:hypothetical protein
MQQQIDIDMIKYLGKIDAGIQVQKSKTKNQEQSIEPASSRMSCRESLQRGCFARQRRRSNHPGNSQANGPV